MPSINCELSKNPCTKWPHQVGVVPLIPPTKPKRKSTVSSYYVRSQPIPSLSPKKKDTILSTTLASLPKNLFFLSPHKAQREACRMNYQMWQSPFSCHHPCHCRMRRCTVSCINLTPRNLQVTSVHTSYEKEHPTKRWSRDSPSSPQNTPWEYLPWKRPAYHK